MPKRTLAQSRLKELLNYNQDTGIFTWISPPKNHAGLLGKTAGTLTPSRGKTYVCIGIDGVIFRAHRLAWLYVYGKMPEKNIDHMNGIELDNRIFNLRDVSQLSNSQNHNKKAGKRNPVGVRKVPNGGVNWEARITSNGETTHIGTFETKENAVNAYKNARLKLHDAPVLSNENS